jgi:(S)-sulfolactate dehydrogenase
LPTKLLDPVRDAHPDIEILEIPREGPIEEGWRAEILLTQPWDSPNLEEVLTHGVRWVHAFGTGIDRFPVELLGESILTCSRGASATAISEWVIAVLLGVEKRLPESWLDEPPEQWSRASLGSLANRKLGLIGFGNIGRAVAKRARAFDMTVIASDPYIRPEESAWDEFGARPVTLESVLRESDAVSLHAPLTEETRHIIDASAIAAMKPGALLINTSRGGTVDEAAMIAALHSGQLGGAAIDVFEREPLTAETGAAFAGVPNLILTPHVAGLTEESNQRVSAVTVENVLRVLAQGESENESEAKTS